MRRGSTIPKARPVLIARSGPVALVRLARSSVLGARGGQRISRSYRARKTSAIPQAVCGRVSSSAKSGFAFLNERGSSFDVIGRRETRIDRDLCRDKIALVGIPGCFIHAELDRIYRQRRIAADRRRIVAHISFDVGGLGQLD